jgi:Tol biopolymer transport system component
VRRVSRGLVVVAVAALVPLVSAGPARPSIFPGANGKIAFEMFVSDELDDEIFVVNPDGSGVTDLTNDPADDRAPCWSGDGAKIVFERDAGDGFDIWVMNADGSGQAQLTSDAGDERAPCWSPDGTKIVFERPIQGGKDLWIMDASGANPTPLTSGENDGAATWSPDGATIAFQRQLSSGGSFDIWRVPATGGLPTNLTNTATQNDFAPCWSPDGATITYEETTTGSEQIFLMDANGATQTPITTFPSPGPNATEPCFSPDGTRIVFVFNFQLYLMNADGSSVAPLVSTEDNVGSPDWQPVSAAPAPVAIAPDFTG